VGDEHTPKELEIKTDEFVKPLALLTALTRGVILSAWLAMKRIGWLVSPIKGP
jgi:hypothetical protein